jgi:hypothetical protein
LRDCFLVAEPRTHVYSAVEHGMGQSRKFGKPNLFPAGRGTHQDRKKTPLPTENKTETSGRSTATAS